ncbi:MAG: hypothetical protein GX094_05470 [Clostridiales bacterium]|jgi:hypothetical protein|nr:hypothetical protein [Clostridiales bacterium]
MFRLWGIVRKNNKIIMDMVSEYNGADLSEQDRLHRCIEEICYNLDLERPIWLEKNQREYQEYKRTVLTQDNFIERINFDTLELEVISDDEPL